MTNPTTRRTCATTQSAHIQRNLQVIESALIDQALQCRFDAMLGIKLLALAGE